ncbi:TnsD family Tn7-like transposition protein [Endozoicomonas ascidiicola]|uniref:TnsD family Tn7-like transposition protein n=1 Tax=Endozoicomonas ascidiicola TaxID=1698521 RepID=UPI00082CA5A8
MIDVGLLPNETIYSLMARLKLLTIHKHSDDFYQALLDCCYTQTCGVSTYRLNAIAEQLGMSLVELLHNHTGYGYYTHFMSVDHRRMLKQALASNQPSALESLAGTVTSRLGIKLYQAFCPHCAEQAVKRYGISYWHHFHELPGITACYLHGVKLIRSPMMPKHLTLPDIQQSRVIEASKQEILFAELSAELLIPKASSDNHNAVTGAYRSRLKRGGYVTSKGMIRSTKLLDDIGAFWGGLLSLTAFQNLRTDGRKHNFVRDLLRGGNKRTHPVKHILLSGFLDSLHQRQNTEKDRPATVANNAGDKEQAITLLRQGESLRGAAKQSGVSYYSIRKIAYEFEIPINGKGLKISAEKEAEVLGLLNSELSMKKIAELAGMSESGVDHILQAHPAIREKRRQAKKHNKESKRELYRQKSLEIIAANPKLHRKALFDQFNEVFVWLKNNDSQWLYRQLPAPQTAEKAQGYRHRAQETMRLKKQQSAINQLRSFARKLLSQPPAQRISSAFILRSLKVRNTPVHIRKRMPLFWEQLSRVAESHEEYQLRKLQTLYDRHPEYFKVYSVRRLLKLAKSFPAVSDNVTEATVNLRLGEVCSQRSMKHLLIIGKEVEPSNPVVMFNVCSNDSSYHPLSIVERRASVALGGAVRIISL